MSQPFSVTLQGRRLVVRGDLDLATAGQFELMVAGLADDPGDVVIDASGMAFIDSSGLRSILSLARRLEGRGRVAVSNAGEQVLRVLDLVGADALIDVGRDRV